MLWQRKFVQQGEMAMWRWLVREWQWPAAALFAAVFLLAMFPLLAAIAGWPLALVLVQLPIYLLHQAEEHLDDRFRRYANRVIGRGREALTPAATFWINCLGVWAIDLAAIYLALAFGPAAGLVAGYLALVNALLHLGPAIARREYNPGLATALLLFVPAGGICVTLAGWNAGFWPHAIALAAAVGVHLVVVAHVARRLARMPPLGSARVLPGDPLAKWAAK
jgi:hypothetical protein